MDAVTGIKHGCHGLVAVGSSEPGAVFSFRFLPATFSFAKGSFIALQTGMVIVRCKKQR